MTHVLFSKHVVLAVLAAAPFAAKAVPLDCAEDKATQGLFCFAATELKESNGIRSAPLWTGGPARITKSAFTLAANCGTGVLHIKDSDGVSFAGGGPGEGTVQSRELRRMVCGATPEASKKKLHN